MRHRVTAPRLRAWVRVWHPVALLGLLTIGAYGVAQYAIGVLVADAHAVEGWSTGALSMAYALGVLASGPVALVAGYALDRAGSRAVTLASLLAGGAMLWLSSSAATIEAFVPAWALGAGVIGGGLYYPMTMATLARVYPERRALAFSGLTLLGALAAPVFYPLAGALVEAFGWREAIRALVLCMTALVLPAGVLVDVRAPTRGPAPDRPRPTVAAMLHRREVLGLLATFGLVSAAVNALHLHQVGAMEAAGLSLAAASGFAGARGFLQIPGRLVLAPLVSALGLRGAAALGYGAGALGAAALWLALAGAPAMALAATFAAGTGFSVGLLSPVQGLLAAHVYGEERLGTLSGVQQLVVAFTGAAGSWVAGALVDATGGYGSALAMAFVALVAAIATLTALARPRPAPSIEVGPALAGDEATG